MDERERLIAGMNKMLNDKLILDALVEELTYDLDEELAELLS